MKISISVPGSTPTAPPGVRVLGDDAVRDFISAWSPQAACSVQTARYPRATQATKFARGNTETVMTFITSRTHATKAAAQLFIARELAGVLNLKGTVTVSEIGGSGSSLKLEEAVIAAVAVAGEGTGVESMIAYRIEGGSFALTTTT